VPFVLLALVALVGGWVNGVDMHGHVVDDLTGDPIFTAGPATITHGGRTVAADSSGNFVFPNLPRESLVRVDADGYLRTSAPVTQEEIRLQPLSFTIQINEAGNPDKHIAKVEIRQGTSVIGTTNDGGNTVLSTPYPGKDAKLLLCAAGYDQKEITIRGVVGTFEMTPGTNACPPLPTPTPSPSPSASPSASPGASPSVTPTPSPSGSP
jgi:hypothetical protein